MGGFGPEKILLLVLVLVLLFGAKRLPELGASLGKGIREFKGSLSGKDGGEPSQDVARSKEQQTTKASTDEGTEPRRLLP